MITWTFSRLLFRILNRYLKIIRTMDMESWVLNDGVPPSWTRGGLGLRTGSGIRKAFLGISPHFDQNVTVLEISQFFTTFFHLPATEPPGIAKMQQWSVRHWCQRTAYNSAREYPLYHIDSEAGNCRQRCWHLPCISSPVVRNFGAPLDHEFTLASHINRLCSDSY